MDNQAMDSSKFQCLVCNGHFEIKEIEAHYNLHFHPETCPLKTSSNSKQTEDGEKIFLKNTDEVVDEITARTYNCRNCKGHFILNEEFEKYLEKHGFTVNEDLFEKTITLLPLNKCAKKFLPGIVAVEIRDDSNLTVFEKDSVTNEHKSNSQLNEERRQKYKRDPFPVLKNDFIRSSKSEKCRKVIFPILDEYHIRDLNLLENDSLMTPLMKRLELDDQNYGVYSPFVDYKKDSCSCKEFESEIMIMTVPEAALLEALESDTWSQILDNADNADPCLSTMLSPYRNINSFSSCGFNIFRNPSEQEPVPRCFIPESETGVCYRSQRRIPEECINSCDIVSTRCGPGVNYLLHDCSSTTEVKQPYNIEEELRKSYKVNSFLFTKHKLKDRRSTHLTKNFKLEKSYNNKAELADDQYLSKFRYCKEMVLPKIPSRYPLSFNHLAEKIVSLKDPIFGEWPISANDNSKKSIFFDTHGVVTRSCFLDPIIDDRSLEFINFSLHGCILNPSGKVLYGTRDERLELHAVESDSEYNPNSEPSNVDVGRNLPSGLIEERRYVKNDNSSATDSNDILVAGQRSKKKQKYTSSMKHYENESSEEEDSNDSLRRKNVQNIKKKRRWNHSLSKKKEAFCKKSKKNIEILNGFIVTPLSPRLGTQNYESESYPKSEHYSKLLGCEEGKSSADSLRRKKLRSKKIKSNSTCGEKTFDLSALKEQKAKEKPRKEIEIVNGFIVTPVSPHLDTKNYETESSEEPESLFFECTSKLSFKKQKSEQSSKLSSCEEESSNDFLKGEKLRSKNIKKKKKTFQSAFHKKKIFGGKPKKENEIEMVNGFLVTPVSPHLGTQNYKIKETESLFFECKSKLSVKKSTSSSKLSSCDEESSTDSLEWKKLRAHDDNESPQAMLIPTGKKRKLGCSKQVIMNQKKRSLKHSTASKLKAKKLKKKDLQEESTVPYSFLNSNKKVQLFVDQPEEIQLLIKLAFQHYEKAQERKIFPPSTVWECYCKDLITVYLKIIGSSFKSVTSSSSTHLIPSFEINDSSTFSYEDLSDSVLELLKCDSCVYTDGRYGNAVNSEAKDFEEWYSWFSKQPSM